MSGWCVMEGDPSTFSFHFAIAGYRRNTKGRQRGGRVNDRLTKNIRHVRSWPPPRFLRADVITLLRERERTDADGRKGERVEEGK